MGEKSYEVQDKLRVLKKYKWLIFNCFFFAGVIAAVLSYIMTPTYQAEATLRIHQSGGAETVLLNNRQTGTDTSKQLMATYADIIKSRGVVEGVIEKAGFADNEKPTYDVMLKRINTQAVKETELLSVKVQADDPEEAQKLTNLVMTTFIERLTSLVRSEQKDVKTFIGDRLGTAKQDLEKAEQAVASYKQQEKMTSLSDKSASLIQWQTAVNQLSAQNKVALASAQARVANANRELAGEDVGMVADNALIQQYKARLADQQIELATLLSRYNEMHPRVVTAKAAVEETKAGLTSEIGKVVKSEAPSMNPVHQMLLQNKIQAQAEMAATNAQQETIARILADSEKELVALPAKEQGLARVMRDASVAQEVYTMLARRYEEAKISEVMQSTDVQIVDMASAPLNPIKPAKALNVIVASLLGLLFGTGIAVVLSSVRRTIDTAEDVRRYLDLPVIASIPTYGSAKRTKK
ncbi:MAG: etk [Firmicutes bacterium]|nr:etk [Bacillota bacterium]